MPSILELVGESVKNSIVSNVELVRVKRERVMRKPSFDAIMYYKSDVKRARIERHRKERKARRRSAYRQELIELYEQTKREECRELFNSCKGEVHPKRGGKANSYADIGMYVNRLHRTSMSDYEGRRRAKKAVLPK